MIIESREEYLRRVGERVGESAEDLSFLEDMTDTYDNLVTLSNSDTVERLTRENEELRRKYRERFFSPGADPDPEPDEPDEPDEEIKTKFEELFKEED